MDTTRYRENSSSEDSSRENNPRKDTPVEDSARADSRPEAALEPGWAATLPDSADAEADVAADKRRADGPPRKIGRYTILDKLGEGGMGVVYRGYDPELHRDVAIKVLKLGRGSAMVERNARLRREAQAMAQLTHPNVVRVYDVGEVAEGLFVAMEFVQGFDARTWLRTVRPQWRRSLGVFRAAGRGLSAAHNVGLVHRDFKPANVMVGDDGRVRVLDFGLARTARDPDSGAGASPSPLESQARNALSEVLTEVGTVLGTPIYMAPEQLGDVVADARSDQFSYCVALYEAIYGSLPYAARNLGDLIEAKRAGDIVVPPAGDDIPPELFAAIERGLAPEPADRWPRMRDLLRQLRVIHTGKRRAVLPWVVIGASIAVSALGFVGWSMGDTTCGRQPERVAAVLAADGVARLSPNVRAPLGRYLDGWLVQREQACANDRGEATQPCFADDLNRVAELVPRLGEGDTAKQTLAGLPSPSRCRAWTGAPQGQASDEQLQRLRATEIDVLLGNLDVGRSALAEMIEQSTTNSAILSRALRLRASLETESAVQTLRQAYVHAVAAHEPMLATEAALELSARLSDEERRSYWQRVAQAHAEGNSLAAP